MMLPRGYTKGKLIKRFMALGPYLRENKCQNNYFFFDCLAICLNTKPAPEKREFLGWWLELEGDEKGFAYRYQYGLFDKQGEWCLYHITNTKTENDIEMTLHSFYPRLCQALNELNIIIYPAQDLQRVKLK